MSYLTDKQKEWFELVLEKAGKNLFYSTLHGKCTIPDSNVAAFWDDIPVPPEHRENYPYYRENYIKHMFFSRYLMPEMRERFAHSQSRLLAEMDEAILAVSDDVVNNLEKLRIQFMVKNAPSGRESKGIIHEVFAKRAIFDKNPSLHPITRLQEISASLLNEKQYIETKKDLGEYLAAHLRQQYNFDLNHGKVLLLVDAFDEDVLEDIKAVLANRKKGMPALMRLKLIKGDDIKVPMGLAAHFAEEAARPRKQYREEGGRAGLGNAKPDLWKPEP